MAAGELNKVVMRRRAKNAVLRTFPRPRYIEDTKSVVLRELKKRDIPIRLFAELMCLDEVCSYNTIDDWLNGRRPNVSARTIDVARAYLDLRIEPKKRKKR